MKENKYYLPSTTTPKAQGRKMRGNVSISVSLSEDEKKMIQDNAKAQGISLSNYIRSFIF